MNNPTVVVWQRGPLRVVAIDAIEKEDVPILILEQRTYDAMGTEAWQIVCTHDEKTDGVQGLLLTEIASHVQVLPQWVRDFVRRDLADFEESVEGEGGGAA